MYAVIKTGGKQYRIKAGDVLVVDKLAGEPGQAVSFDEVLLLGDEAAVTVGAPTVAGASVEATLIETRKGDKIKIFKKIRRQGYRRTGGHRQLETVLRVTAVAGEGKSDTWDGVVDLTPRSVLNARARGFRPDAAAAAEAAAAEEVIAEEVLAEAPAAEAKPAKAKAAPKAKPAGAEGEAAEAAPKPARKKAAPKAEAADSTPSETDGEDA
ncbi:MAG: 50S ribosomal protein L21 [Caulobacteraceae bacterium]|nr:50S ribosomal protein L21 [Caulobacteraceae bacterium]